MSTFVILYRICWKRALSENIVAIYTDCRLTKCSLISSFSFSFLFYIIKKEYTPSNGGNSSTKTDAANKNHSDTNMSNGEDVINLSPVRVMCVTKLNCRNKIIFIFPSEYHSDCNQARELSLSLSLSFFQSVVCLLFLSSYGLFPLLLLLSSNWPRHQFIISVWDSKVMSHFL